MNQHSINPPLDKSAVFCEVIKKPLPVAVYFAKSAGVIKTLEGKVNHQKGDAILTGYLQEQWPVDREVFNRTYAAMHGTTFGEDGQYQKKPLNVCATQLTRNTTATVGYKANKISGCAGDWLVDYGDGHYGIVKENIFNATYDIINKMTE